MDSETSPLDFQCIDIISKDVYNSKGSHSDSESSLEERKARRERSKLENRQYQIILFGITQNAKSVALYIENYKPFFYVRIPNALARSTIAERNLRNWLMNAIPSSCAMETTMEVEQHKTLIDYNGGYMATFMKITFPSQILWKSLRDRLLNKMSEPIVYETRALFGAAAIPTLRMAARSDDMAFVEEDGTRVALKVYESNIDPMLRFFHILNIKPASWVHIEPMNWDICDTSDAKTDIVATCDYRDMAAGPDSMAPFLVGSWDIECNSSHGDFPLAKKTYNKPLRELYEFGIPNTLDEICRLFAKAMNGEKGPLSRIYLKKNVHEIITSEILYLRLEGKEKLSACSHAFESLKKAVKPDARELALNKLDTILSSVFPYIVGDEITQIGTVLYKHGVPVSKLVWVLGSVNESAVRPPGADVPIHAYSFRDEVSMIRSWIKWIHTQKIDVLIGYNIFGFDSKYVYDRLTEVATSDQIKIILEPLSRLKSRPPRLEEKFLSSSAMGDNTTYFLSSPGRLQIDLLPYIRRNHNLDSYTLDNVSATFVSGAIQGILTQVDNAPNHFKFGTKSTKGIVSGRYITLLDIENDRVIDRCKVICVEPKALVVFIEGGAATLAENGCLPVRWAQVKDNVSPKDIFRLHRGSADDRAIIARYCLQDCDLVMELFNKLEILNNSVAMANVCSVPVTYIFTRGQGIKIESLIFKECRESNQLIEVMPSSPHPSSSDYRMTDDDGDNENHAVEDSYEGAIVLEPNAGIYLDDPVTADDFASLYPSTIISENFSHDTLISVKDYDKDGNFVCIREGSDRFDNIVGAKYVDIEFDILRSDPGDTRKHPEKLRDGKRVARYIQSPQGTIPRILEMLLNNRKKMRKLAESETDDFRRALLDAQQLAYKLTANSLYGQLGSNVFKIRRQVLAASTTAYGRKQLMYAKSVIETIYGGGRDPRCDVECVYGDTDSIFLRFRPKNPITGELLKGKEALCAAKDLTIESGKLVSSCLKPPHDFEFDKIFKSFILLSKKRYVGDMSEDGIEDHDFHRKSMGIVMKRRDNAPIVKYIYGNVVEKLLSSNDVASSIREATTFVHTAAQELLEGKFPMSKLTITKSLRANYADPTRIAHKVLADRIGERDPGNKPSTTDRIPFVYITHGAGPVPKLQGDRIELPTYIKEHNLQPDYAFYITNQIAKPISQVFGLALEHMPGVTQAMLTETRRARDPVAAREALAQSILFDKILLEAARNPETMESKGQKSIATFFSKTKKICRM